MSRPFLPLSRGIDSWQNRKRSDIGSVGVAHAAADKGKHENETGNPQVESHLEVVAHSPPEALKGIRQRAHADVVVLREHHSSADNEKNKLAQAGTEGAVQRADSPPVSPSSDKHKQSVECNNAVCSAHESGNNRQPRTAFLTVHVAILSKINLSRNEVLSQIIVSPVDPTAHSEIDIPSIGTISVTQRVSCCCSAIR